MAHTPKYAREMIEEHSRAVEWVEECIRAKALPIENQAAHIQEGHEQLWVARLEGQAVALESLLFKAHCYAGFCHFSEPKIQLGYDGVYTKSRHSVGFDDPEYRDWRRLYYTK